MLVAREIAGPIIKPSVDRSVWKRNFHGYSIHSRASYRCTHDNWFLTNVRTSNRDVLLLFLLFDPTLPRFRPFTILQPILFYNFYFDHVKITSKWKIKPIINAGISRISSIIINRKLRYLKQLMFIYNFLYIKTERMLIVTICETDNITVFNLLCSKIVKVTNVDTIVAFTYYILIDLNK